MNIWVNHVATWCFWTRRNGYRAPSTAQKIKFPIKDFFSKCDRIRSFPRMWSHMLKKSLMKNFIFYAVLSMLCFVNLIFILRNLYKYSTNWRKSESEVLLPHLSTIIQTSWSKVKRSRLLPTICAGKKRRYSLVEVDRDKQFTRTTTGSIKRYLNLILRLWLWSEAYLEPSQTYAMGLFRENS